MSPRIRAILSKPHMAGVAQLPTISCITAAELEALEPFVEFCATHRVSAPTDIDMRAFLTLATPTKPSDESRTQSWLKDQLSQMVLLEQVLRKLEFSADLIGAANSVREEFRHQGAFRGHNHGARRRYTRSVSVAVENLPEAWQETLRKLRSDRTFALSILDRMEQRLGMFAWSADQVGHPVDLANPEAECAFYDDLIARSTAKAIRDGEDQNSAQPRWAYLRGAAEEIRRFATHHGMSPQDMERFDRNYRGFSLLEERQTPLKMFTALQAPTLPVTLANARIQLEDASAAANPSNRHQRRLKACALGITVACPPRARDVVDRMFWGNGVFYRADTNSYAFDYNQSKVGHELKIGFQPSFNIFFNALLLGDNDARYLPQIREQAIAQRRPIFMRYDGEPVAYGWFGRAWDEAIGSSSHLARTLLQTFLADLGEHGLAYGRNAIGHRGHRHLSKYRDEHAKKISASKASDAFSSRAENLSPDDISDLL
ncbi:hypothetical protein [Litoreibacter arenae]|uniref:Uncharacterized protein n=1 Tax=Litoreibacter arenae DSM 19593 TaxID=1123360 RepID=S9QD65_9RHOB|nr:hypothetical protein [Litoreibacter arenae]EPX79376.1 hypothetical protein thalar_02201 [Litoreibacter arenae DSM 19593]